MERREEHLHPETRAGREALGYDILQTQTILQCALVLPSQVRPISDVDKPAHITLLTHLCPELLTGFFFSMKRLDISSFQLLDLCLLVLKAMNTHSKSQKINGRRQRRKIQPKDGCTHKEMNSKR